MLKEEFLPLFVLFVLFGQAKRTLTDKYHNITFLLSYFCMTKRRVQGGEATSERRRRDGVGGREFSLCADESKDFRQPSPVGSEAA